MLSLRDQSNNIRREVLFEIQELGRVQEDLNALQQNVLSVLTALQSESAAQHLQVGACVWQAGCLFFSLDDVVFTVLYCTVGSQSGIGFTEDSTAGCHGQSAE